MKRLGGLFVLGITIALFLAGCEKTPKSAKEPMPRSSLPEIQSGQAMSPDFATSTKKVEMTIATLDKAQKEYLAAYDRYVKMLRESGPQTMETLHALAEYQKKYRLYQTLLEAQKPAP